MMNRLPLKLSLFLPLFALACAADPASKDSTEATESANGTTPAPASPLDPATVIAGTHVGVHGMVLFGSGTEKMYLSHIPLYSNPHNIQVIAEVKIVSGVPADQQLFATKGFTFRPSAAFSLGDLALGQLPTVMGTIFLGNFESGGTPAFRNVKFELGKVVHQHLMTNQDRVNANLEYFAVGTPNQAFLVHLIDAAPSFDHIVPVKLSTPPEGAAPFLDAPSLETGTLIRIANRTNKVTTRIADNSTVQALRVAPSASPTDAGTPPPPPPSDGGDGDGGPTTATLEVGKELSCLPGGDFFGTCPRVAVP